MKPLAQEQLVRRCEVESLPFQTTADLPDAEGPLGQERARAALEFGASMRASGYHVFVLGPPGVGKRTTVASVLNRHAAAQAPASDWCYLNNFEDPRKPTAVQLPAGRALPFRRDMERFVEDLKGSIPAAFENENYRSRLQALESQLEQRRERVIREVQVHAKERGLALARTPVGFMVAPVKGGEVLEPDEFHKLPEAEQARIQKDIAAVQEELQIALRSMPQLEREHREEVKSLTREVALYAVGHLIDEMRRRYADLGQVLTYLDAVQGDVLENVHEFIEEPSDEDAGGRLRKLLSGHPTVRRYRVNVMVDHGGTKHAPLVVEDLPTYSNLFGRIEHHAHFGALFTDFTMIRPGALHRANGGYLVLDARKLILQPFAWDQLKRALRSQQLRAENLEQLYGLGGMASLEPEPIPLSVKIILIGDRSLYHVLAAYDPEFLEHFKVAADFDDEISRHDNELPYARLVATVVRRDGLRAFTRGAVGLIIEQASRIAGDAEKLTARMQATVDLIRESAQLAEALRHDTVTREDVTSAVRAQIERQGRIHALILEQIERGALLIQTSGTESGQVNGLAVVQVGEHAFGHPSRITARVRLGKGEVVDIEREVELGGPLHSKGVLILGGFLAQRFAADRPFALSATIVFEQSYGAVEGDSASSAELYALLSVLAGVPIRQSVAVTGAVNQLGQLQAIGGVNEKIEGFFDVCRARGLSGDQGVVIPTANVTNLMLRADVVDACASGKFHVWAIDHGDDGIETLTGVPAGARGPDGRFPEGLVNARAAARLEQLASAARAYAAPFEGPRVQP